MRHLQIACFVFLTVPKPNNTKFSMIQKREQSSTLKRLKPTTDVFFFYINHLSIKGNKIVRNAHHK